MADDRPAEEVPDAIGNLRRELDDLKTTVAYMSTRSPVGDIEPTFRSVAKPGALLLQGQTVSRTTYANLWKWVSDNGLSPSVFGAGDGSTTFVLPDTRGRFLIGAGTLGADTYAVGAIGGLARVTLTVNQLATHGHTTSSTTHQHSADALHSHSISSDGSHSGHNSGATSIAAGGGASAATTTQNSNGSHSHGGGTGGAGSHTHGNSGGHTHPVSNTGANEAHENRPPYMAVNLMIWT